MSFLGGTTQPPPPAQQQSSIRSIPIKAPVREMKPPSSMGIGDILKNIQREEKKIVMPAAAPPPIPSSAKGPTLKSALRRSAGSTDSKKSGKNSVVIKL
jgi:hypothetical protein